MLYGWSYYLLISNLLISNIRVRVKFRIRIRVRVKFRIRVRVKFRVRVRLKFRICEMVMI